MTEETKVQTVQPKPEQPKIPAWRRRALYPLTEGVSPRFAAGKDLTGYIIKP